MAEYIAKLRDRRLGADVPTVRIDTLTEFEAAALALEQFARTASNSMVSPASSCWKGT